jgi:hypothetical protein
MENKKSLFVGFMGKKNSSGLLVTELSKSLSLSDVSDLNSFCLLTNSFPGVKRGIDSILEKYEQGKAIGYENPEESEYYAAIGKVNLYDLTSIVSEEDILHSFFDTLPMSVIELKDEQASYVRSNASYREFMKRYFHVDIAGREFDFSKAPAAPGLQFLKVIRQLTVSDNRTFFDEKMADGSTVHSFVRRISHNPVTGKTAIAIAILSITKPDEGTSYADIARALAADYYNIYVVDLDTERFIEYSSAAGRDELAEERHGTDFFEAVRRDTMTRVYEEDREFFLAWFSKENIISELDKQGVFTTTYRLIDTGTPMYAHMKVTRLDPGGNRIILGISIIDSQMKHKEAFDKEQQFQ